MLNTRMFRVRGALLMHWFMAPAAEVERLAEDLQLGREVKAYQQKSDPHGSLLLNAPEVPVSTIPGAFDPGSLRFSQIDVEAALSNP